jgi:hypothetical protein
MSVVAALATQQVLFAVRDEHGRTAAAGLVSAPPAGSAGRSVRYGPVLTYPSWLEGAASTRAGPGCRRWRTQ